MMGRGALGGLVASVVVGLALAAVVLNASESRYPAAPTTERLLYLRSGQTAARAVLSFDALAADLYWIRAIQHYGRDRRSSRTTGRFELLEPLLDLTTTLDPRFNVAYRFGAVFLSIGAPEGAGRADRAIALLQKGLEHNPNRWQYAHDIGFVHYFYTHDHHEAARWFREAAKMPGAPQWIRTLAATSLLKGGDLAAAEAMFDELAGAPEAYIRRSAERGRSQVQALRAIEALERLVAEYEVRNGRFPNSWDDLVSARLLRAVPTDASGATFRYDPLTHRVTLAADSPLLPLPELR